MKSPRGLPIYVAIAVLAIIVSLITIYGIKSEEIINSDISHETPSNEELDTEPVVDTVPIGYSYQWEDSDYQGDYPEELAAAYILLRANGYTDISKDRLANLPEESNDEIVSESLNRLVNSISASSKVAVPISGQNLLFVPAPSMIWINEDGDTYPVVFLYADEATVTISNPREGVKEYPFSVFSKMYDSAERQCIYIANRGYSTY